MSEFADLKIGGSAAIDFADDGWRSGIADVVEPCFDSDFGGGLGDIAEAKVVGVGRRIDPDSGFQFSGDAGSLWRIEAGAGDLEDAGELEIVADDLGEKGRVGFRGVGTGSKVRNGHARLVGVAETCACAKPSLRLGERRLRG